MFEFSMTTIAVFESRLSPAENRTKKRLWQAPIYGSIKWQGLEVGNQTFDEAGSDKEWDFDAEEIRELLMQNEDNKEPPLLL